MTHSAPLAAYRFAPARGGLHTCFLPGGLKNFGDILLTPEMRLHTNLHAPSFCFFLLTSQSASRLRPNPALGDGNERRQWNSALASVWCRRNCVGAGKEKRRLVARWERPKTLSEPLVGECRSRNGPRAGPDESLSWLSARVASFQCCIYNVT